MIGVLTWTPPAGGIRQKSVTVEMRSLFHMRVAWAAVAKGPRTPEAVVRRRVLTAARRLRMSVWAETTVMTTGMSTTSLIWRITSSEVGAFSTTP